MKSKFYNIKMKFFSKIANPQSILFHIAGIACLIWFTVRVLPKPDRIYYPCQQISMTVASSYIIFWGIIWAAIFHGLGLWVKRAKTKTAAVFPIILVSLVLIFSVSSGVFADNDEKNMGSWEPIPNEPFGTPKGVNPGRVVWVWNPNATEKNLKGFWWKKQNNNQNVIDEMFFNGIKELTGETNINEAWDSIFCYFNEIHGKGNIGYQAGEKIAIKINLNNCYKPRSYFLIDNERDASPYTVKALLRQLVNEVGVAQEDITIYDASRVIPNWFYKRVYYETYPAFPLKKEFLKIHYVDSEGLLPGREKVKPCTEKIYFSNGITKTLPTCVTEASYIINMPILKRHPIDMGITLSGKNFFGTWIEPVADIHPYHQSAFTIGNPAPQTDLLAHEHIGGKTLLFIGDGLFATKIDHRTIAKFNMYPFNGDWTNSLFFSQDPVAMDSVMYDFLHTEGTNPCEGSQNYLHQSAEPNIDTYDPENDGSFLSESLGVHEHWNKSVDIFSSNRYLGPIENGIDFVAIGKEHAKTSLIITEPKSNNIYIDGQQKMSFPVTVVIGDVNIKVQVNGIESEIEKVDFFIDNNLVFTDFDEPYNWTWNSKERFKHKIKAVAYFDMTNTLENEISVWKFQ